MMFELIFFAVMMTGLAWLWHCLSCNQKTRDQRIGIIQKIWDAHMGGGDYWSLMTDYRKVSYEAHARALERFRNPLKLYPESIRQLMADGANSR